MPRNPAEVVYPERAPFQTQTKAATAAGERARQRRLFARYGCLFILSAALLTLSWLDVAKAAPSAKTPEELIHNLASAANRGSVEDFHQNFTESTRRSIEQLQEKRAQRRPIEVGKNGVFGMSSSSSPQGVNGPTPPKDYAGRMSLMPPADDSLSRLKAMEILSKKERPDGSMELRVKTSLQAPGGQTTTEEDTLLARQENGEWKLAGRVPEVKVRSMSQQGTSESTPQPDVGQKITVPHQEGPRPNR